MTKFIVLYINKQWPNEIHGALVTSKNQESAVRDFREQFPQEHILPVAISDWVAEPAHGRSVGLAYAFQTIEQTPTGFAFSLPWTADDWAETSHEIHLANQLEYERMFK